MGKVYLDALPIELKREVLLYYMLSYYDLSYILIHHNYFKLNAFSSLKNDNQLWQKIYCHFYGPINFRNICRDKLDLEDRKTDYYSD